MSAISLEEKVHENYLRRQAKRLGLAVCKSRARRLHINNLGGYRIISTYRNTIVAGKRLELDLSLVGEWLDPFETSLTRT